MAVPAGQARWTPSRLHPVGGAFVRRGDSGPLDSPAVESTRAEESERIARARHDPDAFATLYRLHYPFVERYLRRRLGVREIVDDLVAETFLVALESLPKYEDRGAPFRAWLMRLATSRLHRWLRRHRHAHESLVREPAVAGIAPTEREEERNRVRRALLALPAWQQSVLALHYLEELPVAEIARVLGCRVGTVKSRLARGREALARKLGSTGVSG